MEKRIFSMKVSGMVKWILPFYLFTFLPLSAQVGTWRNYLSYHDVQQIQAAGDDLFVLASNGLYQYNKKDQSITTYDKTNGLNDTYITHIKWCQQAKRLIAVYSNTNIDLLETNGNVTNISDIYNKAITMGDKSVNNIYISDQYAYLACGFGIVKLNVKDAEISESYMFGHSIDGVTTSGGYIYAKLTDTKTEFLGTPVIPYQGTIHFDLDSLINAIYKTETFVYYIKAPLTKNLIDKSSWEYVFEDLSSLFAEDNSDYNDNIQLVSTLQPVSPKYNYFYFMKFHHGNLYTCGGQYEPLIDLQRPGTIQLLNPTTGDWTIYEDRIDTITNYAYVDIDCLDIDPNDDKHVFAGGRTGLYEFQDGKFVKAYNKDNSELKATSVSNPNNGYVIVNALKFDNTGNIWMVQSMNRINKLLVLYKDGTWDQKDYSLFNTYGSTLGSLNILGNARNLYLDSNGYLWFTHDHFDTPAIYRYDSNNNQSLEFTKFINQDGATIEISNGVRCLTQDRNNNIWIGTSNGPLMLEPTEVESSSPVFTQIKVPRNDGTNYADYLLAGVDILSMAIDGAGRKWFGTNGNGVYLISDDNIEQIHHFMADNSDLLSDIVQSIAINNTTGEVFFGTDKGLCSFMSDATETTTEMVKDNVYAYPNPVKPDYTGLITITGLTLNADVKILSASGKLMAEGRSNGGTFTWDGCDSNGNRVASGIYMVATATSDGQKGTVCKIAVIR